VQFSIIVGGVEKIPLIHVAIEESQKPFFYDVNSLIHLWQNQTRFNDQIVFYNNIPDLW